MKGKKRPWPTEISSIVVTLSNDTSSSEKARSAILAHPALTGEASIGRYLPLTIEDTDARSIHEWIEAHPGVDYIDVVFCSTLPCEDPHPQPSAP